MRVVFIKLQNCPDFSDSDFRDGGSAFQHMGPETAKAREPPHAKAFVDSFLPQSEKVWD